MYWSTGNQYFTSSGSKGARLFVLSRYRRKYQDESTNVSMVSVSRRAAPPHFGHFAFTNSSTPASGDCPSPVNFGSGGSRTGSCSSGTGTRPHFSQYSTGIGVPQYLCREMPQSFSRYVVCASPNFFASASAVIFSMASSEESPEYGPEFTARPYTVNASAIFFSS